MAVHSYFVVCILILLTWYLLLQLPPEAILNHVLESPGLSEWFAEATKVGNPDALLLAMKIREKTAFDSALFGKLLPNPFCPNKVFAADHLSSLATCLKVVLCSG